MNVVLSGNLITLSKTFLARCRNFTSVGVNRNTVMVNLTTMIVNRTVFNKVFGGFTLGLLSMIFNTVVCCVMIRTIVALNFSTGLLGILSTTIITVFLTIPC